MATSTGQTVPIELGLDIGVASVGWTVTTLEGTDGARAIMRAGVHLFDPGTTGDMERGKDEPPGAARRMARAARRQTWRRMWRKRRVLRTLIKHRLLPDPANPLKSPADVDAYLKEIDAKLRVHWLSGATHLDHQKLPYLIRAAAVQRSLSAIEFGRALYHLAQRRGFLSNRRTDKPAAASEPRAKDDAEGAKQDPSVVKRAIEDLQSRIAAHPVAYLGAYLSSLDPHEQRIRHRWTSREMFVEEFDAAWSVQAGSLALSEAARRDIWRAIFQQRPLKDQSHLIGECSLIPGQRRALVGLRQAQRFRLLDRLNNLTVMLPGEAPRPLVPDERTVVVDRLMRQGDLSLTELRRALGMKKTAEFNLDALGDKKLIGHRTDAKLRAVFGDRFDSFTETEKDRMVEDIRSYRSPEGLVKRAKSRWSLGDEAAHAFAAIEIEESRLSLSLAAINRLMPCLERGETVGSARRAEFPEQYRTREPLDLLPPLQDESLREVFSGIRNPAVLRALTEARKVINALIRRYGKPVSIRIEIARELKQPRGVREKIHKRNAERSKERAEVVAAIVAKNIGFSQPEHVKRADVEKWLLAEECGWDCPYTGRQITPTELLGRQPQFDIEHIWPRSRSLDDSLLNKTLCFHQTNVERKGRHTPFEAFGASPEWPDILQRVRHFRCDPFVKAEKLRRFTAGEIDEGFENRHLSDTRHIARALSQYVEVLYGGRSDESGQRVWVTTGGLTAWLRTGWGLDTLLDRSGEKNRDDHRHHALDAIIVALSTQRAVQVLAKAAAAADARHARRAFDQIDEPWSGFRDDVKRAIDSVVVSFRQGRKVAGGFHNETLYSREINGKRRVRKELRKLSSSEIAGDAIVDKRALAAIRAKLAELGKSSPSQRDIQQVFSEPANAPLVKGHDGRMVCLRHVRVEQKVEAVAIGAGASRRFVKPASNHHTVIFEVLDKHGKVKGWGDEPVTMMEAHRRVRAKQPVVNRDLGPARRFLFSLAQGEFLEMDTPDDATKRDLYRVSNLSEGDIELKQHRDGRTSDEQKRAKARIRVSGDRFRKLRARKVHVTYLGEVKGAGG